MATNLDIETSGGTASPPANQLPTPMVVETADATTRKWVSYILIGIMAVVMLAAFVDLFKINGPTPIAPSHVANPVALAKAVADYNAVLEADSNFDADRLLRLLNIVFGPVVTLVSSVVGFYFGARTAREGTAG